MSIPEPPVDPPTDPRAEALADACAEIEGCGFIQEAFEWVDSLYPSCWHCELGEVVAEPKYSTDGTRDQVITRVRLTVEATDFYCDPEHAVWDVGHLLKKIGERLQGGG